MQGFSISLDVSQRMRFSLPFHSRVTILADCGRDRDAGDVYGFMDWGRSSRMKRTNSDEALSSMTVDFDARGQICPAQFQDQSIVWTNEKHNSYIQSLEDTFVQELHQSGGFTIRNLHQQQFVNTRDSSDKFTVLQDGCRKTLQPRSKLHMDTTNNKIREKQRMHSQNHDSYHLSRSNAALAEVSDQNFTEDQQS